jgi:hypothetical protein
LKITPMVQVAPAATVLPQVFVCEKSVAFAPVNVTFVIASDTVPVLVKVTFCAALELPINWLANVRLAGEAVAASTAPVPVMLTL